MRQIRFAAWIGLLAAVIVGLERLNDTSLALPDWSVDAWRTWLTGSDITTATFSLVLAGSLVTAWYLLTASIATVLADLTRVSALRSAIDAVTVPAVRNLARGALGVTVVGALAVPSTASAATAPNSDVPVMRHLLPGEQPISITATTEVSTTVTTATTTVAPETSAPRATTDEETWTITPGDNLWSIAESHLEAKKQQPPTLSEISAYWETVIERNRSVLADPSNADLVFPGQVINLPPPSDVK